MKTQLSRRAFLAMGSPNNATPNEQPQQSTNKGATSRTTASTLAPAQFSSANPWDYRKAAHLLRRTMIGATDKEIRQAVTDGLNTTLTKLFTAFTPSLEMIKDWAGKDPQTRPPVGSVNGDAAFRAWQDVVLERRGRTPKWWLSIIASAPISIQEVMTMFWHNHFVSEADVVNYGEWVYVQNQLLRQYALGNFKDFVKAVTIDPAMLIYLDGRKNYKTGNRNQINENYSRELMELFTMGVNDRNGKANYTQQDVSEGARALSGWDISPSSQGSLYSGITSNFISSRWDNGTKTFLGKTGAWNTDDALRIIFEQRSDQIAKFIAEKLYKAFVYSIPDYSVVDGMAATFLKNNFAIKPVMDELLRSEHFFDVTNMGALERNPTDYMIGMVRAMGLKNIPDFTTTGRASNDLVTRLLAQGQLLYSAPNVKGWAGGRSWVSSATLPLRQQVVLDIMDSKITTRVQNRNVTAYEFDPITFVQGFPDPHNLRQLSDDMAQYFLNSPPSAAEKEKLFQTILDGGRDYEWSITNTSQKAAERIRKFIKAAAQLAKFQLA